MRWRWGWRYGGSERAGPVRGRWSSPAPGFRSPGLPGRHGGAAVHAVYRHSRTLRVRDGRAGRGLERGRYTPRPATADHRSDHLMTTPLTLETITQAPKALLHDHLDGGLRPATVIDIAGQTGYDGLPATEVDEMTRWFQTSSHSGSLERYLEPFSHTVAVMQTPESLHRVAYECVEDLSFDSVVYAEVRFAPELHINRGLSFAAVTDAVLAGFGDGAE